MDIKNDMDYFSIHPPRLEDAGLEESALPIEGIQEAFRRAAEAVKSGSINLIPHPLSGCPNNPGPSSGEWEDVLLDPFSTALEKDDEQCIDCVTTVGGAQCDAVISPPDQQFEDALLVGKDAGPKLGEGECVVTDKE